MRRVIFAESNPKLLLEAVEYFDEAIRSRTKHQSRLLKREGVLIIEHCSTSCQDSPVLNGSCLQQAQQGLQILRIRCPQRCESMAGCTWCAYHKQFLFSPAANSLTSVIVLVSNTHCSMAFSVQAPNLNDGTLGSTLMSWHACTRPFFLTSHGKVIRCVVTKMSQTRI